MSATKQVRALESRGAVEVEMLDLSNVQGFEGAVDARGRGERVVVSAEDARRLFAARLARPVSSAAAEGEREALRAAAAAGSQATARLAALDAIDFGASIAAGQ